MRLSSYGTTPSCNALCKTDPTPNAKNAMGIGLASVLKITLVISIRR
ncbi:MAG: hypothetical protein M3P37_08565 [Actinomycetota bacterium]|nr:hypothetical protein [Actinomycetota bacterium]